MMTRRQLAGAAVWLGDVFGCTPAQAESKDRSERLLPELTHTAAADWINSAPLRVADLRGSAALVHVWTFACWNCYRSFPWLNAMAARLPRVKMVGVHTPELDSEHDRKTLRAKIKEYRLAHAIMIDDDGSYWRALDNRYSPAWYLVDKKSRVRSVLTGETHEGDSQAVRIERELAALAGE